MVRHRFILLSLVMVVSVLLSGCLSRKLAVMDLKDTLDAVSDELCGAPLRKAPEGGFATVTLATTVGVAFGVDGAGIGIPISASGSLEDSTTIAVDVVAHAHCTGDASTRFARRPSRAVYSYDTATGRLTPLNDEARARLMRK
jgi:hypothetical protein